MAASHDGTGVVTGHADGTIYRFYLDDGESATPHGRLTRHHCPPYALAWGRCVLAAGPDKRVNAYDEHGKIVQTFDYSSIADEREPSVAVCSPSGQSAVFGSYNRLRTYDFNIKTGGYIHLLLLPHIP